MHTNTILTLEGRKPSNMFVKLPLGQERRRAFRTIRKHLGGTNYRQDLTKVCASVNYLHPMMTIN